MEVVDNASDENNENTRRKATAFNVLGKRNECIALFKQLEEVATEKDKEYIQNSIKFVQEQLEK